MAKRKSFLLRISPELYEKLERWAADELRSANAQIEYLLADAVRRAGRGERNAARPADGDREDPTQAQAFAPGEPPPRP